MRYVFPSTILYIVVAYAEVITSGFFPAFEFSEIAVATDFALVLSRYVPIVSFGRGAQTH